MPLASLSSGRLNQITLYQAVKRNGCEHWLSVTVLQQEFAFRNNGINLMLAMCWAVQLLVCVSQALHLAVCKHSHKCTDSCCQPLHTRSQPLFLVITLKSKGWLGAQECTIHTKKTPHHCRDWGTIYFWYTAVRWKSKLHVQAFIS